MAARDERSSSDEDEDDADEDEDGGGDTFVDDDGNPVDMEEDTEEGDGDVVEKQSNVDKHQAPSRGGKAGTGGVNDDDEAGAREGDEEDELASDDDTGATASVNPIS